MFIYKYFLPNLFQIDQSYLGSDVTVSSLYLFLHYIFFFTIYFFAVLHFRSPCLSYGRERNVVTCICVSVVFSHSFNLLALIHNLYNLTRGTLSFPSLTVITFGMMCSPSKFHSITVSISVISEMNYLHFNLYFLHFVPSFEAVSPLQSFSCTSFIDCHVKYHEIFRALYTFY